MNQGTNLQSRTNTRSGDYHAKNDRAQNHQVEPKKEVMPQLKAMEATMEEMMTQMKNQMMKMIERAEKMTGNVENL